MAISAENLSISGVENILHLGEIAYSDLLGDKTQTDMLEEALLRIQNLIVMLVDLENQMCNKLGVGDINEFKQKYDEAVNAENLNKVTGSELKRNFLNAFNEAAGKYDVENKRLELLAQKILDEIVKSEYFTSMNLQQLTARFHGLLLEAMVSEKGCKLDMRALTRAAVITQDSDGPKILAEAITPTIKERLNAVLKIANSKKKIDGTDFRTLDKINISNLKSDDNPIVIEAESEWLTLTQAMTSNKLEAYLAEMSAKNRTAFLNDVNTKMTDYICNTLEVAGDSEVRKAINAMLKTKLTGGSSKIAKNMEDMFFVGTADTEVTGLLGEIAAYAALKKAFGPKVKLQWAAQALEGGKQLSIDIVLNQGFGIQVKNTSYDLNQINYAANSIAGHGIDFVDKTAYDVIQQLTDSDALGRSYETSYFNISYTIDHDNKPHVVAGASPDFDDIANDLVSLREKIDQFLLTFSPELIYMANDGSLRTQLATLDSSLQKLQGNVLYIVGNQPVFASEMLGRIETQINNLITKLNGGTVTTPENAFKISGSKSRNIVKYLNDRADKGEPVGLERQGKLVGAERIKLTSTYRF